MTGFEEKHTPINPIGEWDEKIQDMNDREDVWLRVWDKHSQEIENDVGKTQIEYLFFESEEINFEWVEFNIETHAETQIDQNQNHWDCLNHILYNSLITN